MKTLAKYLLLLALLGLNLPAQGETLLRCEGTSVKTIWGGSYRPSFFEECKRDMCGGDIVDFWMITEFEAFPTDLPKVPGEYKLQFDERKEYGFLVSHGMDEEGKPTGRLLQINPITGEYYFQQVFEGYTDNRKGMCEKVEPKDLF